MKVHKTKLNDCLIIEPDVFQDERGFFLETYNEKKYFEFGISYNFVQDNHSRSSKGVLRGLHFQKKYSQGKLVRVTNGEVYDVVLDIRKDSSTFGMWESFILSGKNKKQLFIPPGFAHGFLVISDTVDFEYKCTEFYNSKYEETILWNDPDLNINWPYKKDLVISDKDLQGKQFKEFFSK